MTCTISLSVSCFQSHAPAKVIFLVSNLMILSCIPFRLMGDTDTEEAILIFAVPGSWFLLMFFAGYCIYFANVQDKFRLYPISVYFQGYSLDRSLCNNDLFHDYG